MRIETLAIGMLLLILPAQAQVPEKLPLPHSPGQQSLQFGAASITITMPAPESPAPILVTAAAPGTKPVTLSLDRHPDTREFPPNVSLVEMDPANSTPEFFVSRFSGGAHCCAEIQILDVVGGQWRIVDGGSWDGEEIIPEDADGDGEQEIVHGDDRFLYRFSCYACAGAPIRVFKLVEGALADVSIESPLSPPGRERPAELPARLRQSRQWRLRLLCGDSLAPGPPRRSLEIHARSLRPQERLGIEGLRARRRQGQLPGRNPIQILSRSAGGVPSRVWMRRDLVFLSFFRLPGRRG